jgi:hypothetical protein
MNPDVDTNSFDIELPLHATLTDMFTIGASDLNNIGFTIMMQGQSSSAISVIGTTTLGPLFSTSPSATTIEFMEPFMLGVGSTVLTLTLNGVNLELSRSLIGAPTAPTGIELNYACGACNDTLQITIVVQAGTITPVDTEINQ